MPSSTPWSSTTGSRFTLRRAMMRAACAEVALAWTVMAGVVINCSAVTAPTLVRSDRPTLQGDDRAGHDITHEVGRAVHGVL